MTEMFEIIFFLVFSLIVTACIIFYVLGNQEAEYTDVISSEIPDNYPDLDLPKGVTKAKDR